MIKWTEKDVLEHAKELRSPFEEKKGLNLAEKIKELLGKKEVITQ